MSDQQKDMGVLKATNLGTGERTYYGPAGSLPDADVWLLFRPLRSDIPVAIRLRKLLKSALRVFGFRLLEMKPVAPNKPDDTKGTK